VLMLLVLLLSPCTLLDCDLLDDPDLS